MTKETDTRLARLEEAIGRLEHLGSTQPVPSPLAVNPDGTPGHVAPGELIESAWGNSVSDSIAYLWPRKAQRYVLHNPAELTVPPGPAILKYDIGQFTLAGANMIWHVLVTVSANVADGDAGLAKLVGGFNGGQVNHSVGMGVTPPGHAPYGAWLTAAFTAELPSGSYTINAFGQVSAAGGWMQAGTATIIAFPNA